MSSARKLCDVGNEDFPLGDLSSIFFLFTLGLDMIGLWTAGLVPAFADCVSKVRHLSRKLSNSLSLNCNCVVSLFTSDCKFFSLSVCSRFCWSKYLALSCFNPLSSLSFLAKLSCKILSLPSFEYLSSLAICS